MITQLSPTGFAAWRDRMSTDTLPVVLDVRETWELQTACVREDGFKLLHIPLREVPERLAQLQSSYGQNQPMACLCHHGVRSLQVATYLAQNGFIEVVNLQGGIAAWAEQLDSSVPRY